MTLDETFDLPSFTPSEEFEIDNSHISDDVEYAKKNLRDLIDNSLKMVPVASRIAKDSESARSIEVFSGLIKTLSEMNKDLISLQPKQKEDSQGQINNTQNNLFIGSTEDLFSKIKDFQFNKEPQRIE